MERHENQKFYNDFSYIIVKGKVAITNYSGIEEELVIPDIIDGYPVVEIASNCFSNNLFIKKIICGNNVSTIGENAFSECPNLKELIFNSKISNLGKSFIFNSKSIEEIYIETDSNIFNEGHFNGTNYFFKIKTNCDIKLAAASFSDDSNEDIRSRICWSYDTNFDKNDKTIYYSSGFYYFLDNNDNAVITFGDHPYVFDKRTIVIPKILDNHRVCSIGNEAFKDTIFDCMILPDCIKKIHSDAFLNSIFICLFLPKKLEYLAPRIHDFSSKVNFLTHNVKYISQYPKIIVYPDEINNSEDLFFYYNFFNSKINYKIICSKTHENYYCRCPFLYLNRDKLFFDDLTRSLFTINSDKNGDYLTLVATGNLISSVDEIPTFVLNYKIKGYSTYFLNQIYSDKYFYDINEILNHYELLDMIFKLDIDVGDEDFNLILKRKKINIPTLKIRGLEYIKLNNDINYIRMIENQKYIFCNEFLRACDNLICLEGITQYPFIKVSSKLKELNDAIGNFVIGDGVDLSLFDRISCHVFKDDFPTNVINHLTYLDLSKDLMGSEFDYPLNEIINIELDDKDMVFPSMDQSKDTEVILVNLRNLHIENLYVTDSEVIASKLVYFVCNETTSIKNIIFENANCKVNCLSFIVNNLSKYAENVLFDDEIEIIAELDENSVSNYFEFGKSIDCMYNNDKENVILSMNEDTYFTINKALDIKYFLPPNLRLFYLETSANNIGSIYLSSKTNVLNNINNMEHVYYYGEKNKNKLKKLYKKRKSKLANKQGLNFDMISQYMVSEDILAEDNDSLACNPIYLAIKDYVFKEKIKKYYLSDYILTFNILKFYSNSLIVNVNFKIVKFFVKNEKLDYEILLDNRYPDLNIETVIYILKCVFFDSIYKSKINIRRIKND